MRTLRLLEICASILALCLLLLPLVIVWSDGGPISGLVQESAGYRYYNTLRLLHGERPWQPQAQAMGLLHLGFQHALSAVGFSETSGARLEVWIRLAQLVAPILTAAAFIWATRPIQSLGARLFLAAMLVSTVFEWRTGGGYSVFLPDYQLLCVPFALVMLGWFVRPIGLSWRSAIVAGVFGGFCLATKPTYAYALPVGLALVLLVRSMLDVARIIVAAVLAVATVALVLLVYYQFDVQAVANHITLTRDFMTTHATPSDPLDWWLRTATTPKLDRTIITVWLPVIMLVSLVLRCHWRSTVPLFVGYLFALRILAGRPEPNTWTETEIYAIATLAIWWRAVVTPRLHWSRTFGVAAVVLSVVLIGAEAIPNARALASSVAPILRATENAERIIGEFTGESGGRVGWLMADGHPFLASTHALRAKGMTDIGTAVFSQWAREAYPHDPDFLWAGVNRGVDLSRYDRLIITSDQFRERPDINVPVPEALIVSEVEKGLGVTLKGYDCEYVRPVLVRWPLVLCRLS